MDSILLEIEKEIKELEEITNKTEKINNELLDKQLLTNEEINELLDIAFMDLTLSFCISKLKGEVSNELLYKASSLKETMKKYNEE